MIIKYESVFAENFNSYEEFSLPIRPGKHLILGPNGGGKSSLLDSLPYTQYKFYERGSDPSRYGRGNCMTGVEFSLGKDQYRIRRFHKHRIHKNKVSVETRGKDGQWREVADRLEDSADKQISGLVQIPKDLFISTVVVMQKLPISFCHLTPSQRKEYLESSIGSSVWDKYKNQTASMISDLEDDSRIISSSITSLESDVTGLETRQRVLQSAGKAETERLASLLKDLDKQESNLRAQLVLLEARRSRYPDSRDVVAKVNKVYGKVVKLETDRKRIKDLFSNGRCPTCRRRFSGSKLSTAQDKVQKLSVKILRLRRLHTKRSKVSETIHRIDSSLASIRNSTTQIVRQRESLNNTLTKAKKNHAGEHRAVMESLAERKGKLEVERIRYKKSVRKIEHARFVYDLLLPSSKFRTALLSEYISRYNQVLDQVAPLVFPGINVSLVVNSSGSGVDLSLERDGDSVAFRSLSGGEEKRVVIATILAWQRFLLTLSGTRTNLVVLDEIFDGLDEAGVQSVLDTLEALYPKDMAVYIISHNKTLMHAFDSIIQVSKKNGVSRVRP